MGAINRITSAYATLRTTVGLKRMWSIALAADLMLALLLLNGLRTYLTGGAPVSAVAWVLGFSGILVGKGYLEYSAYRLISQLPVVPIAEVKALANLDLLARVWTVCFLTLLAIVVVHVGAAAMLVMALVAGVVFGLFAWLFFKIGYIAFIELLMSPFLGFFKVEAKLFSLIHLSPQAAILLSLALLLGLFIAPAGVALIVIVRRSRLLAETA